MPARVKTAEELKAEGNALLKAGNLRDSEAKYSVRLFFDIHVYTSSKD
jgi:hypothetical protein